ncbi:MAG: response regulator transcription factor [Verrucomicrobiota bacterium]
MPTATPATLLIVDDTPDNIAVLFDYLGEQGFRVLVCESGQSALDTLGVEEPDLILLDVMMPGMDGFETCRRLKQLPAGQDVPVFFMTALGDPIDKVRGLAAGAIDYLTKPVYPEEVLSRVRAHLEIRRLQKSLQEQNDRLDAALQRSQRAEEALQRSLGQALLIRQRDSGDIVFATRQARDLLSRHGGESVLADWLAHGPPAAVTLQRQPEPASPLTELITLRETPPEPRVADLRSLGLTPRETEILFWIAQGKTSPEIAIILGTQTCTVKKHVENFLPKLGVETRLAAALRAQEVLAAN